MTTKIHPEHPTRGSFFTSQVFFQELKEVTETINFDRGEEFSEFPDVVLVDAAIFNANDKYDTTNCWKATAYGFNTKTLKEKKEDAEAVEMLSPIFMRTHGALGGLKIHPETTLDLTHPDFVTWLATHYNLQGPIKPGSNLTPKK